ncbi:stage III sporulation protein AA [Paenibacillus swuensis]|uniref:Stage III sporulation protein AA n=1 Tax=Paenibacillus swuensis TaxID=1178515 RepID=A0A172TLX8_9BACL|nr:stage III sporulation protein AA [Paenibacillus swuensis]ANE48079.1 stage III sporulation protein AA [Paenibacillus swuensis]
MNSAIALLPLSLQHIIASLPDKVQARLEEIRIRENRPLEIVYEGHYRFVTPQGMLSEQPEGAYLPPREECLKLLDLISNHSLYTLEEELRRGYITVRGGHRIGLAGRAVLDRGQVKQLRDIAGFNIRLAKEIVGAADALFPLLLDPARHAPHHTLLISPPQQGKTTLLRDLARIAGSGVPGLHVKARKVGIVDERSELAACVKGVPTFNVGSRTDVLDACPKAEGMMMMIRSMSPEILIVDEIGRREDAEAIQEALHAGIIVIATAHGRGLDDIRRRPILSGMAEDGFFGRYVVLGTQGEQRTQAVYDGQGRRIQPGQPSRAARSTMAGGGLNS